MILELYNQVQIGPLCADQRLSGRTISGLSNGCCGFKKGIPGYLVAISRLDLNRVTGIGLDRIIRHDIIIGEPDPQAATATARVEGVAGYLVGIRPPINFNRARVGAGYRNRIIDDKAFSGSIS